MKNSKAKSKPTATQATKPTLRSRIRFINEVTKEDVINAPFLVVPDDAPISEKCLFTFTRTQYAKMIRQWRNDPTTLRNERNYPTPSRISLTLIRYAVGDLKKEVAA